MSLGRFQSPILLVLMFFLCQTVFSANTSSSHSSPPSGSCQSLLHQEPHDENLWLEEILDPVALDWVERRNKTSLSEFEKDPRFEELRSKAETILLSKENIPYGHLVNGFVYNFWQGEQNIRGLWRRTSWAEYQKTAPQWETLLDIDLLAREEGENWVYKGSVCLMPHFEHCLVKLSRGGKDAVVVREFSMSRKTFVKDGFYIPESKTNFAWKDQDTLIFGTTLNDQESTDSGYTRSLKEWKRNTPINDAKLLFEVDKGSIFANVDVYHRPEGTFTILYDAKTFYTGAYFLRTKQEKVIPIAVPEDATLSTIVDGQLIFYLRSDWVLNNSGVSQKFKAGSLISIDFDLMAAGKHTPPQLIIEPTASNAIHSMNWISGTRNYLFVNTIEHVKGRLLRFQYLRGQWKVIPVKVPQMGSLESISAHFFNDSLLVSYDGFLESERLYSINGDKIDAIKAQTEHFNSSDFKVEQHFAKSKDGTSVPYFLVAKKDLSLDGTNRTLMYGYGGFEISQIPQYSGTRGKLWLDRGGVYVLANIRGGGEYGPEWHQAALKENRQKSFDDFIAVAEDLIQRRVTSPQFLGAKGGSNGGLLMGAMLTQRPDLFKAIICQVPLLDMLRYHKLLAGASWMGEFGNPDLPEEKTYIEKYSPYHNLHEGVIYPKAFFMTSTKDDRVHPAHARKMVARLEKMNHRVYYFENTDGGHGASANLNELIHRTSLEYIYLSQELQLP